MTSKPICWSLLKTRFFLGFGKREIYVVKALNHDHQINQVFQKAKTYCDLVKPLCYWFLSPEGLEALSALGEVDTAHRELWQSCLGPIAARPLQTSCLLREAVTLSGHGALLTHVCISLQIQRGGRRAQRALSKSLSFIGGTVFQWWSSSRLKLTSLLFLQNVGQRGDGWRS